MDARSTAAPTTVALAVASEVSMIEVAVPCEIFGVNRTDLADPWYAFTVCATENALVGGLFRPDHPDDLTELTRADTVIIPSVRQVEQDPPAELIDAVRAAHDAGARMVSICTGAFVLAAAGLLDGRRATIHWMHSERFAARYPRVKVDPTVLYVDEGDVLTAAGKAASIDLCLHLVRLDHGAATANALARRLIMPPHRDGGQAQFIAPPAAGGGDHALSELLPWVIANLDRPLTVPHMARMVGMSDRNLARHFNAITGQAPLQWLLARRLCHVQELLETTDRSIEQIARVTGMATSAMLRRHFKRAMGITPDAYRHSFRDKKVKAGGAVVAGSSPLRPVLRSTSQSGFASSRPAPRQFSPPGRVWK